jgi:hypothetical protein
MNDEQAGERVRECATDTEPGVASPLDKHRLRVFAREVVRQCDFTVRAARDCNAALKSLVENVDGDSPRDGMAVWYAVQALLVSAANVSKLLFPGRGEKISGRGKSLRDLFGVQDDSPLASRTFRNYFEHFDRELEIWALSAPGGNLIDDSIGDPSGIKLASLTTDNYLRFLNTTNQTITFRGEAYEVQPVIDAVLAILDKAHTLDL